MLLPVLLGALPEISAAAIRTNEIPTTVNTVCDAPNPRPAAMQRKRYTNSSGSLIGVRNRTIESAPTRPSDRARDDFTIVMMISVVRMSVGELFTTTERGAVATKVPLERETEHHADDKVEQKASQIRLALKEETGLRVCP
jgi:hypothetical protein